MCAEESLNLTTDLPIGQLALISTMNELCTRILINCCHADVEDMKLNSTKLILLLELCCMASHL